MAEMGAGKDSLTAALKWEGRAPLRMRIMYLARNRHLPDLNNPTRFNELIQLRKLTDRNPLFPLLADKVLVKPYVAERLGEEWLIPTLWHGKTLPERPLWEPPFVVKSNHASQQCMFIRSADVDWQRVRRKAHNWLKRSYGGILDEWLYGQIDPQLLVEPFVGGGDMLPIDYKFFVFGGRAEFVQVDTDREHRHKRTLFDREWRRLPVRIGYPIDDRHIPRPETLPAMIEAAEELSRGFDFLRADFYEVEGKPLFGEMTFYPNSGLDRFTPPSFDQRFGALWLAAKQGGSGSSESRPASFGVPPGRSAD